MMGNARDAADVSIRELVVATIERSATFEERIAGELVSVEPIPSDEVAAICRAAALSPKDLEVRGPIAATLGRARWRDVAGVPGWADALAELMADPPATSDEPLDAIADDDGGAFAFAFDGFVRVAASWLDGAIATSPASVAVAARRGLLTWLCRSLASQARFLLYDRMRASSAASPREYGRTYLSSRRGWASLLMAYPVLARLFGATYDRWRSACGRLFARLAADWGALGEAGPATLSNIAALALKRPLGKSPPLRITLPSGRCLVYHDKDLRMAAWFGEVVAALGREGLTPALRPASIIARDDYAWSDFVEPRACEDRAQAERYFERIGVHLRLFQALRATDMHARNVVAVTEHPVFIDLEALLQPARAEPGHAPVLRALRERHARSPLGSSLLPLWLIGEPGRRGINVGGLNRGGVLVFPGRELALVDATTRDARYAHDFPSADVAPTVPIVGGRQVAMVDYLAQIIDGYLSASVALANSDSVRELVPRAEALRVTVLWRSGFMHKQVFDQSLSPTLLTDGRLRDAFLTRLMLGLPSDASRALARSELIAIREGAGPVFGSRPASTSAELPEGGAVADIFAAPALECVELVRSSDDEARDVDAIASAIGLEAEANGSAPPVFSRAPVGPATSSPVFLDHAVEIANMILGEAITAGEESMWIGAAYTPTAGVRRLDALPLDLLSGNAGLATVFAYLYRRTREQRFRQAATRALAPVIRELRRPPVRAPFGAYIGIGAQVYALRRCGELLGDAALSDRAREVIESVSAAQVVASANRDVIMGAAGLVLVVANLFQARPANIAAIVEWLQARTACPRRYPERGGARAGLPDEDEGVNWALVRWGASPAGMNNASLLTRIACASPSAIRAVRTHAPGTTLDDLLVTLAARDSSNDAGLTARANQIATSIVSRRQRSGRWLDDPYVADRYHLSAVTGLAALALAFARIDAPDLRCCTRLVY